MNRSTYKNYIDEWEVKFEKNSETQWSIAESDDYIKVTGSPIDKLAEFEDFMENEDFYDIQSIKDTLHQANMELYSMESIRQENQELKYRWDKLKEWIRNEMNNDRYHQKTLPKDLRFKYFAQAELTILNKIQELEKE